MGEGGGFSWGGVEGWGEKAYDCNWITIKKIFKWLEEILVPPVIVAMKTPTHISKP